MLQLGLEKQLLYGFNFFFFFFGLFKLFLYLLSFLNLKALFNATGILYPSCPVP